MLFSIKRTAFQNVIAIKVGHFARLDYLDKTNWKMLYEPCNKGLNREYLYLLQH